MCGPCSDGTYAGDQYWEREREEEKDKKECGRCGAELSKCSCWKHYEEE